MTKLIEKFKRWAYTIGNTDDKGRFVYFVEFMNDLKDIYEFEKALYKAYDVTDNEGLAYQDESLAQAMSLLSILKERTGPKTATIYVKENKQNEK